MQQFNNFENKKESVNLFNDIMLIKGKLLLFNFLNEKNSRISEACLYFFLSAELGNPEGHYYSSLCYQFRLDNYVEKYQIMQNSDSSNLNLKNYFKNRPNNLALTHLYSAAVANFSKAKIALGNKFILGDGVIKDCPASIAYLKDIAYEEAVNDEQNTHYLEIKSIEKEIFNLGLHPFKSKKQLKSSQVLEAIRFKVEQGNKDEIFRLGFMYILFFEFLVIFLDFMELNQIMKKLLNILKMQE